MDFNIFTLVGEIIVLIAIILIFLISITFILGNYTLNNDKLMFPKLLLLALNLTYQPTKNIMKFFKCDELFVDRVSINLRNRLNINSFKKLNAKDLIVILPHCLRAKNCPAKLGSSGLSCIKCGKCKAICPYDAIAKKVRPCAAACGVKAISSDERGRAQIDDEKCGKRHCERRQL